MQIKIAVSTFEQDYSSFAKTDGLLTYWDDDWFDNLLDYRHNISSRTMNLCYICNSKASSKLCPVCNRPVCKSCMKNFPFSESLCLDCAKEIRTGLGGTRKDEEIF